MPQRLNVAASTDRSTSAQRNTLLIRSSTTCDAPPAVDRLGTDAVLLRHVRNRLRVGLPENRDHMVFGESGLLHGSLVSPRAPLSSVSWSENRQAGQKSCQLHLIDMSWMHLKFIYWLGNGAILVRCRISCASCLKSSEAAVAACAWLPMAPSAVDRSEDRLAGGLGEGNETPIVLDRRNTIRVIFKTRRH